MRKKYYENKIWIKLLEVSNWMDFNERERGRAEDGIICSREFT